MDTAVRVFAEALYGQRRALIGWGVGVVLLVLWNAALWPAVRQMPSLNEVLAGYPPGLRRLFDLQEFGTGARFLNAELFRTVLPPLMISFGVARGARAVAAERDLIVRQGAALTAGLLVLGAVIHAAVLASSVVLDLGVTALDLAGATLSMVLLGFEFGCVALAAAAVTGRRTAGIAVGSTAAAGAYALYLAGGIVSALRPWRGWSPIDQALAGGPLGAGLPLSYLAMPAAAAAVLLAAIAVAERRHIPVVR
jgi:ABC-2 type transport system permease protein